MYFISCKKDKESYEIADYCTKLFRQKGMKYVLDKDIKQLFGINKPLSETDPTVIISIGDDNTLLDVFRELGMREVPVLGIASTHGFLAQADASNYQHVLDLLIKKKFGILKRSRIQATINRKEKYIALNDIGIFPAKSASLLRYTLQVNSQMLWNDMADGVIVSTPTGSTGYSYSAHGPIILDEPEILSINSISSTQKRAPVIVPNRSRIEIMNIDAQSPVAIMDGDVRISLKQHTVVIEKSKYDAHFIGFSPGYALERKLKKRTQPLSGAKTKSLPPSAKLVYKILSYEGSLTQKDIVGATFLPERTVRHALDILLQQKLITAKPHLLDARQTMYEV